MSETLSVNYLTVIFNDYSYVLQYYRCVLLYCHSLSVLPDIIIGLTGPAPEQFVWLSSENQQIAGLKGASVKRG